MIASMDDSAATTLIGPVRSEVWIGRYRLLQKIGEGGMGAVWIAEQREPIHRHVAVKVIKVGMDTREVIARFEGERQALALMDHPAIAKVLDAGSTDRGLPYFVMEYVKGEPITAYCERHRLPLAERLELFVRVCEGVQHAHQKGIIHRDLKPSNILVTLQEEQPVPKIIDFGIAKATARGLTGQSLLTEVGAFVGTPEYMSPEQAEMTGLDVDTRTDVYALGLLLYELLTGSLPFDREQLRSKGLDEIRRVIRDVEPVRPSTTAAQRGRPAAKQLEGDLDWITMKALEKDRTRRYDSATALGNDVLRHLRHEPVSASPPGTGYRMKKFVRRNRFAVTAAGAIALLLIALTATMAVQAERVSRERDRANGEAEAAKVVSDFLVSLFQVSDPDESKGNAVTAREILDQGAARIETELQAKPLTRVRLLTTIGTVYTNLGLYEKADSILDRSLLESRSLQGGDGEQVRKNFIAIGLLRWRQGAYAESEQAFVHALSLAERADHSDVEIADVLHNLGVLYDTQGKSSEAERALRRSLAIREQTGASGGAAVARTLNSLAATLWNSGEYAEAETMFLRALNEKEAALGSDHPDVANTLNNLGILYKSQAKLDQAGPLFERALRICEKVYGPEHREVADALNNIAALYEEQRRFAEAETYYRRALAIWEKSLGPEHSDVGIAVHNLANVCRRQQRYPEAEQLYLRSHAIWEKSVGPEHPYIGYSLRERATLYRETGRPAEAEPLYRGALSNLEASQGAVHPDVADTLDEYGELLRSAGRLAEAEALERRAKAIRQQSR